MPDDGLDLTRISTLYDLQKLLELLGRYDVGEFEIEAGGRKLRVSKQTYQPGPVAVSSGAAGMSGASVSGVSPSPEPEADKGDRPPPGAKVIRSPMVGTFYRASSPEADPFVKQGDRVEEDTTVCIIEAMKVMNEIPSGSTGVVQEILVDNGESVEYSQPLFYISPDE